MILKFMFYINIKMGGFRFYMKKIIKSKEELIKKIKKEGHRQLFLAQWEETKECYFMINNDDCVEDLEQNQPIEYYIRDIHDTLLNITTFALAIKLGSKVYIAFIDFKSKEKIKMLHSIITQELLKLRIINSKEDYMLTFKNSSIDDFLELFNLVLLAVQNENYNKKDYDNFTTSICNTYTNEELWNMWKNEIRQEKDVNINDN